MLNIKNANRIKYLVSHFLFLIVVIFSIFVFSTIKSYAVSSNLTPEQLTEVNSTWGAASNPNRFPHYLGTNSSNNPYPYGTYGAVAEYKGTDYLGYPWHSYEQSGPYLSGSYNTTQYTILGFTSMKYFGTFVVVAKGNGTLNMDSWTYGETAGNPTLTNNTNTSAAVSYHYYGTGTTNYNSSQRPTEPGTYRVEASVGTDKTNYRLSYKASKEFEIRVPKIEISVQKEWNDNYNQWGHRPEEVTVGLYADSNLTPVKTLILNSANNWSGKFTDVDSTKTYAVQEVHVPENYTAYVEGNVGNGFIVYNIHKEITTVTASLTKKLQMPADIVAPNADFIFTFEPLADSSVNVSDYPNIPDLVVSFTDTDEGTILNDTKTITKQSEDILAEVKFTEPGIYKYTVKEKNDTYSISDDEKMTYSDSVYVLTIIVSKGIDGTYVSSVSYGIMDTATGDTTNAPDGMVFINNYEKLKDLVTDNTVTDDNSHSKDDNSNVKDDNNEDADKEFIDDTIINPDSIQKNEVPSSEIIQNTDKVTNSMTIITDVANKVTQTNDKASEQKTDADAPKTTEDETANDEDSTDDSQTPHMDEQENNEVKDIVFADLSLPVDNEISENTDTIDTANTKSSTSLTGVILNNLPFITLIGLSIGALSIVVITKIKKINYLINKNPK